MKWISFPKAKGKQRRPANYVRRRFVVNGELDSAVLTASALGVYIPYLNSKRISEEWLLPGYTDYNFRVQSNSFDLTDRLVQGENELLFIVGDGWFRGSVGIGSKTNCYGRNTSLGATLILIYRDGTKEVIEADERFEWTENGPLRENDLKVFEIYDARKTAVDWRPAVAGDYAGQVIQQEGERLIAHERFSAKVIKTPNGETVLDFGQNMTGYVAFSITNATAGTVASMTMGETLDENGNFTMKNLIAEGASLISGEVGQKLTYICKDGRQSYKPMFLLCGFRYVLLENWPEEIKSENFTAHAVYSDLPFKGSFTCSDETINSFVRNVRWSMKSNFVDIPTDCPTRERAGWTGDISVFAETSCYLANPSKFLKKWLTDYLLEQGDDGNLPYVVPEGGYSRLQRGSCGWSDAVAHIALTLYQFFEDKDELKRVYPFVKRFADFQLVRAQKKNPLSRTKNSKDRKYIIETGFHYGEWLEPDRPMYKDFIRDLFYPDTEFTTAQLFLLLNRTADMAEILDEAEDAKKYKAVAEKVKAAYTRYFLPDGKVKSDRQCRYVRPLLAGLTENPEIAADLNEIIVKNNYKIGTGFHTTYKVLSVLCDYGYTDTAYRMLENRECPGWLYEVMRGATTTWENWNGIAEDGTVRDSHNHYAPGAVAAWLFAYCAGIRPLKPGFEEVLIKPFVGGTLTWAQAKYESIQGIIFSRWERNGSALKLTIKVPVKTRVELPDGSSLDVDAGEHVLESEVSL